AAVRHVVHTAVTVRGEITQIVNRHIEQSLLDCPSHNTGGQRRLDHRGEDGDDVESHAFRSSNPSGGSITIFLPSISIVRQMSLARGIRISPFAPATTSRLPPTLPSTLSTVPTSSPPPVTTWQPTRS